MVIDWQPLVQSKDTAMGVEDVALLLADYLIKALPGSIERLVMILVSVPATEIEFIELMGARRGCLSAGGRVDLEKASAILVNEFRAGMLGAITLETPDMILEEELVVAQQKKVKADRDADRKQKFRSGRASDVQDE